MDVIEMARALGKAIQQDDRYTAMMLASQRSDENEALQLSIDRFNKMREDLSALIMAEPRDEEKIAAANLAFRALYNEIMSMPDMVIYSSTKAEFDKLVAFVNQIITASASGTDPDTVEEMEEGCGGSCASCSGCSH